MIAEALAWLATPCSLDARRHGHLAAAIALHSRAARCRSAWAGHIAHCHQAVRHSLAHCRNHRTALVLGSGLALEYPLAELAARFRRVILADVVHLWPLRRLARRFANVELLACDLAEGLPAIADADWVLSANLISQLPLIPVERIGRRQRQVDEGTLEAHGREIMARHLDGLAAIDAERCLIADAEQSVRDRSGKVVDHADYAAVFGFDRCAYATWRWDIAPPGELSDGLSASHRMVACRWPHSSAAAAPSGNSTSV